MDPPPSSSIRRGTLLAFLAAVAFGGTAPFVARAGAHCGSFAAAMLLYLGAAIAALFLGGRPTRFPRARLGLLFSMVAAGAVLGPAAYVAGLTRVGPTVSSLVLNAEAPLTVLLAALILREHFGARVRGALSVMVIAGALLASERWSSSRADLIGIALTLCATLGWAIDNVLARKLADVAPLDLVLTKGALGAAASGAIALALGETWPRAMPALALLGLGALGYGVGLRLYLMAQAQIGAGRTGSIFAVAPFLGAALSIALGDRSFGWQTGAAALLFAVGVYLHVTEPPPRRA